MSGQEFGDVLQEATAEGWRGLRELRDVSRIGFLEVADGLRPSGVATGKPFGGVSFPFSFSLLPSFSPRLL